MPSAPGSHRVAVLLPCRNEEASVGGVVRAFREALPGARVYVYVNASTDRTAEEAAAAGAVVRSEDLPGKGNVVRRMFADIEADVYVVADGDGTYEAAAAPALIERLVAGNLDMAVGVRAEESGRVWRRGHRLGNALISALVNAGSGSRYTDAYSGYRALSRRLVKSFPAASRGFEIELELAMHCARLRLPCAELPTRFAERAGGESKLRTWRDGARALLAIGLLAGEAHPLRFFAPATSPARCSRWPSPRPRCVRTSRPASRRASRRSCWRWGWGWPAAAASSPARSSTAWAADAARPNASPTCATRPCSKAAAPTRRTPERRPARPGRAEGRERAPRDRRRRAMVDLRGLEPLTSTLPVWRSPS